MNNLKQELFKKQIRLEEKIQDVEGQIITVQKQKDFHKKEFLKIPRELSNLILFEKIKSEAKGLETASDSIDNHLGDDTNE